jgi:PBSX family phage terminase large subunit
MPLKQEEFEELIELWSQDHVLGIESLFDIELTNQQIELVRLASDPNARVAVSSCTGSGKTSCMCMLTLLYLMILPDCRILITAPTSNSLERVFRSEIEKWFRRLPPQIQDLFELTQRKIEYKIKTFVHFASLVTASVEQKEALQGGHSESYVVICDEASGVSEEAFDILLGTLSTGSGGRFILVSNPVRSSGRFYEIFNRELGSWKKLYFSAFDSPQVNKAWIQEMEDTYGIDSDLYRTRVLGQFPRVGVSQFISADTVEEALRNKLDYRSYHQFPKVMGVDVARFGDDLTALVVRQGPKMLDYKLYKGLDTMEVATKVAEFNSIHNCAGIYIDSIGVGAGTADRCRDLKLPIKDVVVSNKSTEPERYANLRSQLWGKMREWLENSADLPSETREKDINLPSQLTSMEYGYNNKMQIQLLSKKDIKKMGYPSPDVADALSFTFFEQIRDVTHKRTFKRPMKRTRTLWV